MTSEGWKSSVCRMLMSFLGDELGKEPFCDSTLATQPLGVFIQQSRMTSMSEECITMSSLWSHSILFPCKSLHIREYRFKPALAQYFMGHNMCTHSLSSSHHTFMQSFPFMVVDILQVSIYDMTWGTWNANQCVLHEQMECFPINHTYHLCLHRLFNILHEPNCFSYFFLFCYLMLINRGQEHLLHLQLFWLFLFSSLCFFFYISPQICGNIHHQNFFSIIISSFLLWSFFVLFNNWDCGSFGLWPYLLHLQHLPLNCLL